MASITLLVTACSFFSEGSVMCSKNVACSGCKFGITRSPSVGAADSHEALREDLEYIPAPKGTSSRSQLPRPTARPPSRPPTLPAILMLVAIAMNRVYLDFNATTPVDPAVLDAMLPYFSANFANASSIHTPGQRARNAVETAREQVAALIGANPKEIIFTSGGTESDNHAIFGIINNAAVPSFAGSQHDTIHVITTAIEHEAVLNACQAAEKRGAQVTYLPVDKNGQVNPATLKS